MYYAINEEFNIYLGFLASAERRVSVVYHCLQYWEDAGPKGRSATFLTETELKIKFILFTRNPRQLTRLELSGPWGDWRLSVCREASLCQGGCTGGLNFPASLGLGEDTPSLLTPRKDWELRGSPPCALPLNRENSNSFCTLHIPYASLSEKKKNPLRNSTLQQKTTTIILLLLISRSRQKTQ